MGDIQYEHSLLTIYKSILFIFRTLIQNKLVILNKLLSGTFSLSVILVWMNGVLELKTNSK